MNIETTEDLAEKMADWLGIYGACKSNGNDGCTNDGCAYDKNKPFCCRVGFTGAMKERMTEAVENDNKIDKLNERNMADKIMVDREERFLNKALEYKKQYEECAWWKFKKRSELYRNWKSSLDLMMRYAKKK